MPFKLFVGVLGHLAMLTVFAVFAVIAIAIGGAAPFVIGGAAVLGVLARIRSVTRTQVKQ